MLYYTFGPKSAFFFARPSCILLLCILRSKVLCILYALKNKRVFRINFDMSNLTDHFAYSWAYSGMGWIIDKMWFVK